MTFYIDPDTPDPSGEFARLLKKCIFHYPASWSEIIFLCIGSDRMTGDCLGPYIGYQLKQLESADISVYGTIFHPVHALNLEKTASGIRRRHPEALVIAIDAALGEKHQLGYITLADSPLHPGSGVHKALPPVGHIHITGIVNLSGALEQLTLQTTRLSHVVHLANIITDGIQLLFTQKITQKRDSTADICPQYCPKVQACTACTDYLTKSLI